MLLGAVFCKERDSMSNTDDRAVNNSPGPITFKPALSDMWALFMLVVVYTFNFIDRQIVSILAVPIKSDLGLSDTELSLMGGFAFALFYTTLAVPIALLADRKSRVWVITIALSLWSVMTAICGTAQNFWQLFLARLGVGVGEAGGVAPSHSLITDYFPPHMRARALSFYSFGIPIGSALGILLGGVLTSYLDWRSAFIIVGILGVILAPFFRLTVREPVRGRFDPPSETKTSATFMDVFRVIRKKPSFWFLALGAASSSMMGYGLIFWLPSFFVRSFGDALPTFFSWLPAALIPDQAGALLYASYFYALILLIGGISGIWVGGYLGDRFGSADKGAYATIPAWAFVLTLPFLILGVLATDLVPVFLCFLLIQALSLVWLGPVVAAFQGMVPANMRAAASAIFMLFNNLIGLGFGNLLIGLLSDAMTQQFGAESLRYAMVAGSIFYLFAALLMFQARKTLDADWGG